ncbi:MAG: sulfatase [Planctomycetes bacterium]|nr:sulfatase [Planctomycetota bacterium]
MFASVPVASPRCSPRARALLGACGGADAPALPASRALPLTPLAAVPAPVPRTARVLRPTDPDAAWTVEGEERHLIAPGEVDDETYLLVKANAPRRLVVPGPFRTDELDRVEVGVRMRRRMQVRVVALKDGVARQGGTARSVASFEPQVLAVDLPQLDVLGESFDALAIEFAASTGSVLVHHVELVKEPLPSRFPPPDAAPVPLSVADDTRAASTLVPTTPRGGSFRASAGDVLRFSYAVPAVIEPLLGEARLALAVRAAGGEVTRSLPLARAARGGAWGAVEVDLGELGLTTVAEASWRLELVDAPRPDLLALVAEARVVRPQPRPRTVLLVTSDTHRGDHVGAAPDAAPVSTPTLDALARRGLLFEDAFSTTNVTLPSHTALLTGVHPRDTGLLENRDRLGEAAPTLAEAFRAAGFRTFAAVSAVHLGDARSGMGQGFDRLAGPAGNERTADETVAQALGWLDEVQGEPLFLWVHVFDAHGPYEPPQEYIGDAPVPGLERNAGAAAAVRAYRGEVAFVDHELGRLLAAPRLGDAVVAVTADHGEVLGNHGVWFEHAGLYTDTLHVPLLLAWPGGPRGERVHERVQHLGLGRTLLDLAGLAGVDFPGTSLLVRDASAADTPLFGLEAGGAAASVTAGDWHLILHLVDHEVGALGAKTSPRAKHQVELFRLSDDPGCTRDLVDEMPERVRPLRDALVAWLLARQDRGWGQTGAVDAETEARLVALGYAGAERVEGDSWIDPDCECEWCSRFR